MTEELQSIPNPDVFKLPGGSQESTMRQMAAELAEKWEIEDSAPHQEPVKASPKAVTRPEPQTEIEEEVIPDPDDIEAILGESFSKNDAEDESELPEELSLEDLAKQYKTTPEKLLEKLKIKTKVHDVEESLALKDVIRGYQTDKSVTQKAQHLAEREREVEAVKSSYQQRVSELDNAVAIVSKTLESSYVKLDKEEASINWNQLREERPDEFAVLQLDFMKRRRELDTELHNISNMVRQEQDKIQQEHALSLQKQQELKAQRYRLEKEKLFAAVPQLKDDNKRKVVHEHLNKYLLSKGFTQEELQTELFADSRVVLLTLEAMRHAKAKTVDIKEKVANTAPKVARPTTRAAAGQAEKARVQEAEAAFMRNPTRRAAMDALAAKYGGDLSL